MVSPGDRSGPAGRPKGHLRLFLRDALIALLLVILILVTMFAYSGLWPPLVVVESNSMMHGDNNVSHIGTIDTGDLVLVKKVDKPSDIVTYAAGLSNGHRTYGDYGDVVIYRRGGSDTTTPIIHRAMVYLQPNADDASYTCAALRTAPQGSWSASNPNDTWDHLTGTFTLLNVGWDHWDIPIDVSAVISYFHYAGTALQPGLVTKGDHNQVIDQVLWGPAPLVKFSWVVGKARGEIPWFGLLKLWNSNTLGSPAPDNSVRDLWISIAIIVISPIVLDMLLAMRDKRRAASKKEPPEMNGPIGSAEPDPSDQQAKK